MTADRFVRPARLRPGDRVAVVGTSSPIGAGDVDRITAMATRLGLDLVVYPSVTAVDGDLPYLSGSDRLRADDLTAAWCDDTVVAAVSRHAGRPSSTETHEEAHTWTICDGKVVRFERGPNLHAALETVELSA